MVGVDDQKRAGALGLPPAGLQQPLVDLRRERAAIEA
jgi:hypothetical protein